jgi:hypothetical protein
MATVPLAPAATVAAESTDTVVAGPTDTVVVELTDTVVGGSTDTVAAESTDTVAAEPAETVAAEPAETVAAEPAETVAAEPTETVAAESTETVAAGLEAISAERLPAGLWQVEMGGLFPASRVRRITRAQDALTHAEESVYDTLWGPKNQSRDMFRFASLGYDAIAKVARVTKMNAKWIVERLIHKGFVKIEALPDPLRRIPTKYRVYSYRAALDNMAQSNRLYVIRTGNGVLFAHPFNPAATVAAEPTDTVAGDPGATVSPASAATVSRGQAETVSSGQQATVSPADTLLGNSSKTGTPSNVVAAVILRKRPSPKGDGF